MPDRIIVQCQECSTKLAISDATKLGKKMRCPKCSEVFVAKAVKDSGTKTAKTKRKSTLSDEEDFNLDGLEMEDTSTDEDQKFRKESRELKTRAGAKHGKKRKSNASKLAVIVGSAVAAVVLIVTGLLFIFGERKTDLAAQNSTPEQQSAVPNESPDATREVDITITAPDGTTKKMSAADLGYVTSENKLKHIGLALNEYYDEYQHFPAASSTDDSGKPLLSWRVHILPFFRSSKNSEQMKQLHKEFHLDEPWDSPHNSTLIAHIPVQYSSTVEQNLTKQGKTRFVFPMGVGLLHEGLMAPTVKDIPDDKSNTILVVEVASAAAVVWTKPDDLNVDLARPHLFLKGARRDLLEPGKGFLAVLGNGDFRFIKDDVNMQTLKALFTRNAGDTVGDF